MIRTSTCISPSPPILLILFSCSTLSTLAWAFRLMSPISSRKIVPPLASSNFPFFCLIAEVKEPFSCPNNSLSINSEGIAAQLTSINAFSRRLLFSCNCLDTNSLPQPFGPVIRTRASEIATLSIISFTFSKASECPIISYFLLTLFFKVWVSWISCVLSVAFLIVIRIRFRSKGFSIKS